MTPETFAERVPRLYRLAMRGAAEGIGRHGLLPAHETARRAGLDLPLPLRRVAQIVRLPDGTKVTLTDNSPLNISKLAQVLDDGLTPADWLAMLNDRVFFWPNPAFGKANAAARRRFGYDSEWQVYDTARVLTPVWHLTEIAPINTGATLRKPTRRGRATFASVDGLDFERWRARRGLSAKDRIKEVTVRGCLPDAAAALLDVTHA